MQFVQNFARSDATSRPLIQVLWISANIEHRNVSASASAAAPASIRRVDSSNTTENYVQSAARTTSQLIQHTVPGFRNPGSVADRPQLLPRDHIHHYPVVSETELPEYRTAGYYSYDPNPTVFAQKSVLKLIPVQPQADLFKHGHCDSATTASL